MYSNLISPEELRSAVVSFVATILLDQYEEHTPMTLEDAALSIHEWTLEGVDFPEGMTAPMLTEEWNRQLMLDSHGTMNKKKEEKTMYTAKEIITAGLYDSAVALMDDEIRESVHDDLAPCSEEEFLAEYMIRHNLKYGEPFTILGRHESEHATAEIDDETASKIHDMLAALSEEPNFDTFDASPNYHCFPDLCELLGVDMSEYSSYGDLFYALMDAAISRKIDITDIHDNIDDPDRNSGFSV